MTDETIIEKLKLLLSVCEHINLKIDTVIDNRMATEIVALIERLKAENTELKKHPHCPPCDDFFCYSEKLKEHDREIANDAINVYKKIVFEKILETEKSCKGNRHCVYACDAIRRNLSNIELIL